MSHRIGEIAIIQTTEDSVCELCGNVAELRPYGQNGENICFDCGMKNTEQTEAKMAQILFGETKH